MFSLRRVISWGLIALALVLVVAGALPLVVAQEDRPVAAEFGDPPIAELISISAPDEEGLVTIQGDVGAVFPGSVVAIRNMYSGETIYPRSELSGSFFGQLYGSPNTPYWFSPAVRIEAFERNIPGALPGGPGVILYSDPLPANALPPVLPAPDPREGPVTPIQLDGDASEWAVLVEPVQIGIEEGGDGLIYALANQESFYLAIAPVTAEEQLPTDYRLMELGFSVDGQHFSVQINPRQRGSGTVYQAMVGGSLQNLGPLMATSIQANEPGGAIEMRFPRTAFTGGIAPVTLETVRFVNGGYCLVLSEGFWDANLFLPVAERDEIDSRTRLPFSMSVGSTSFTLGGSVGGGTGKWEGVGRINRLAFEPGDTVLLELRITMQAPALPGDGTGLQLGAALALEPVAVNGVQAVADRLTGNGWSGLLTPSGLAIENVAGGVLLGDAVAQNLVITEDVLTFTLQWQTVLDEALADGLYTPSLTGFATVPGLFGTWSQAGLLGSPAELPPVSPSVAATRFPVVLQIGEPAAESRLVWSLFQDDPAGSGMRGLLPVEDSGTVAIAGHTTYPGGAYVLPASDDQTGEPIAYPLEPYLPAMLANSSYEMLPPLVPLALDSGQLSVRVTMPDGIVDDLGTVPLVQNRLSSPARLEAQAFGADSPLDMYRLTTLDPRFTSYVFTKEGRHRIEMTGSVRDIWGHEFSGGGVYEVWIAEPLQMLPGVLPGTPFEVGDVYNPALTVEPGFPADVTIALTIYPLDGSPPIEYETTGTANAHGYYHPGRDGGVWQMDTPGEYVVSITARYTDPFGRLWIGSVRGAGVIATPEGQLVARGGRWLANVPAEDRLAWYALAHVAPDIFQEIPEARLRWPYHKGDVLWARDELASVYGGLRFTDSVGAYEAWLASHLAGWQGRDGANIQQLVNQDELPMVTLSQTGCDVGPALVPDQITNAAYAYLNAVRAGVTVRQMVIGDETPGLIQTGWDFDDPHNYQRGVGVNGDLPGDYTFLFGGAVVHNAALDLHETTIYGSLLMTIDPEDPDGTRVFPPLRGAANGPDGGPLLTPRGVEAGMFFISTGFQPGQIFTVGDTLALSGQMAPTLPGMVRADVHTPSGLILTTSGQANTIGYYYDPGQNLVLNEPGIWRIRLQVSYDGLTSAGQVQPPYPVGGVPGAENRDIYVYVLPEDAPVLELDNIQLPDSLVPMALPFNLTAEVPPEWDDVLMHYTVIMNGLVLDSGVQPAFGDIFAYNYDPRRLNQEFPNLDVTLQDTLTSYSADAVRMTFVLLATDAEGEQVMAGRAVTLFGDRLLTLHDSWPVEETTQ